MWASYIVVLFGLLRAVMANELVESSSAKKCCVSRECRRTCANPNPPNCSYSIQPNTNEDGCQCKSGYILSKIRGKCIKIEDCPKGCNGDPHAIVKECPVPCPATCEMPEPMLTCKRKCDPIGCECESGYILSDGKCILPDDCKGGNPCGETALFSSCKSYCPYDYCPVDDSRELVVCEYYPFSPCYPGCICKLNHKRKSREDNRCIVSSDCPPVNCTRPNEEWSACPSECLAETCEDVDKDKPICNTLVLNCQPKCICKPNTYRDKSDTCIGADECREINSKPICGYNEEYVKCKTICPPQSCDISYTEYACGSPTCEPGCDCIMDHLRNKSGVCIPNNECSIQPVCGYNEEYVKCKTICPPQSCDISYTEYACGPPTCEPGCDCIKDHLRNKSGVCIPNNECSIPVSCPIPSECRPTCSNRNPSNCAYTEPSDSNVDGCQCKKDYILSEPEGNCIKIEDCPLPKCGYNEIPASCRKICPPQQCGIDPAVIRCMKPDCEPGCDCIEDHLRNASGICIPSNKCPPKCGLHEIPVTCKTVCPPQSCLSLIALFKCSEEIPCELGCDCQSGYLRNDSGVCIPSDQCFK